MIPVSPARQAQQARSAQQAPQAPRDPLDLGDPRGLLEILPKGEVASNRSLVDVPRVSAIRSASERLDYGFRARLPSLVARLQFAKMSRLWNFFSTLLPK